MNQTGELLADWIGDELNVTNTETTIELNFAIVELKQTININNKQNNQNDK